MKVIYTSFMLSMMVLLVASFSATIISCSDNDDKIQAPVINSFTPESAFPGSSVTISGSNFSATPSNNQVTFNGAPATVTSASATELIVTVPISATTGKITVTVKDKTVTSLIDFTVLETTITTFSPTSGIVGTTVTIMGTNFSTTLSENIVRFNGAPATVSGATPTQLTVTVPAEATTGKITVTSNGNTITSLADFTVPAPIISNYFPSIAASGISVKISGTNFSSVAANNIVKFNGVNATVTSASATELIVTVPAGATTGPLSLKVGGNTFSTAGNFEICTGSAELVISDIVLTNTTGATSYLVSFKITNVGTENADLTQMTMQNYASQDLAVGNDVAASGFSLTSGSTLLPGQSYTTPNFSCNISGGNTSSYPVLIITLSGAVTECNTTNNIVFKSFQ